MMTFLNECFARISSLHPLVLALKCSLRHVRKIENDKLALDCDMRSPASAQTLLRAIKIKAADFKTKDGKHEQVAVAAFQEISNACTQQTDGVNFKW